MWIPPLPTPALGFCHCQKPRRGITSSPLGADVSEAGSRRHRLLPLGFFTHQASGVGQSQQTLQFWVDPILQTAAKVSEEEAGGPTHGHTSLCEST